MRSPPPARAAFLARAVVRVAPVLLLHWMAGAALTLAARPAAFDAIGWACPVCAVAWLAPLAAPRALLDRRRAAARAVDLASGATLALVVVVAAASWIARGAGWPPFLSPLEFGDLWLSSLI
jgi:hypothetical protein